jgi:hypothetical protein
VTPSAQIKNPNLGWRNFSAGIIYFVRSGNFLKIGWTSNLEQRMESFETCNPDVELLAAIGGTLKEESDLHQKFDSLRYKANREWFRYEGALKEFVASL